jgi:hypothetical protein
VGLLLSVPFLASLLPRFGGVGAPAVDNVTNASVAIVALLLAAKAHDAHTLYMRARAGLRHVAANTVSG